MTSGALLPDHRVRQLGGARRGNRLHDLVRLARASGFHTKKA